MSLTCAQPDRYNVCVYDEAAMVGIIQAQYVQQVNGRPFITFFSHNGTQLPDCKLLTLHAICAWVVHQSRV